MSRAPAPSDLAGNLANNLRYLRQRRDLTQSKLSKLANIPRPTLSLMESGEANPTLSVLARLSEALSVSIDELLSTPRSRTQLFKKGTLPIKTKGSRGTTTVQVLLPDPIPGLDIERIEIAPGGRMTGVPHRPGTREYLTCEKGTIKLFAAGEELVLGPGDVAAFQGDQPHSYVNPGKRAAVGFSVVALA